MFYKICIYCTSSKVLFIKFIGMGNCLCKDSNDETSTQDQDNVSRTVGATILLDDHVENNQVEATNYKFPTSTKIDELVLEILNVIGLLVDK